MRRRVLLLGAICGTLVGCGLMLPEAGEGGMGLPRQLPGETYPGPRQHLAGEVVVATNGCVLVRLDGEPDGRMAVWPAYAELGDPVRLPRGVQLSRGDRIRAIGAFVEVGQLAHEPDGYWAHVMSYCAPEADDVLVLDSVTPEDG